MMEKKEMESKQAQLHQVLENRRLDEVGFLMMGFFAQRLEMGE
jgi:hypothetical protein